MVCIELSNLRKANLELLDADFSRALRIASVDCQERPGEEKPRKVILAFELRPAPNQKGVCERVLVDPTTQTVLPKTNPTGTLVAVPHAQGDLWIRSGSPDDPQQTSFVDPGPIEGENDAERAV